MLEKKHSLLGLLVSKPRPNFDFSSEHARPVPAEPVTLKMLLTLNDDLSPFSDLGQMLNLKVGAVV